MEPAEDTMNTPLETATLHPLDLPATEIANGLRKALVTSESVIAESVRRARAVCETLNPFTVIREDQALDTARAADRAIARGHCCPPQAATSR